MGALSFSLPFAVFLYLLPSLNAYSLGKVANVIEQLNNLVDIIGIPNEIHGDNGEIEFELVDDSLNPSVVLKPVEFIRDPTKLNVGFQAKVESKNLLLSKGISTNVQLANQAKWSQSALSSEKTSKEFSSEEKSPTGYRRDFRGTTREENKKNTGVSYLYIPNIKDILREKFPKASMQLGLDVDVTSKDTDENADKIDVLVVDNRSRGKKNYIQLCKRLTDGSTTSLQKLLGKDCVKLPRREFYLESRNANRGNDDTIKLIGLKIGTRTGNGKDYKDTGNNNENKQRRGMTDVDASISDISANYDETGMKVADKFGTGLNIKMIDGRIAHLLRDGKLSLSASTTLNV